jgi:hypothetical protein
MSLADAIRFVAAGEVNIQEPSIDNFVAAYQDSFASAYSFNSKGQLEAIVRDSVAAGTDPLENINIRLDEWVEKRPGKIALNETVRLASAVAKTVFVSAGITKLVWSAQGSNSCPFCQELDGQVMGIEKEFSVEGLDSKGHPPIHEGCECSIVPE